MTQQQRTYEAGFDRDDVLDIVYAQALSEYQAFENTNDPRHIDSALKICRSLILYVPQGSQEEGFYLSKLASFLGVRFHRTGALEDLEEGICVARQSLSLAPLNHPSRAKGLTWLSAKLILRYDRLRTLPDLSEALSKSRQAVELAPDDAEVKGGIATILIRIYETSGELEMLQDGVSAAKRTVELTPDNDPSRAVWLSKLASALDTRYERLNDISDLHNAIVRSRQAVELAPSSHIHYPIFLNNLANVLDSRYQRFGDLDDLRECVSIARQATTILPKHHPGFPTCLYNLGIKLGRLYDRAYKLSDLQESVSALRQAAFLTSSDNSRKMRWLKELGNRLQTYYDRVGKVSYLDEAVSIARQVLGLTPDDDLSQAGLLSYLGTTLLARYQHYKEPEDLQEAIALARQAVKQTSAEHISRARMLGMLANGLRLRYDRLNELNDLQEAISLSRESLQLKSGDLQDQPFRLHNLGLQLARRYERLGDLADIKEGAVRCCQAAKATAENHRVRRERWNYALDMFDAWFERTDDSQLQKVVSILRQGGGTISEDGYDYLDEFGVTRKTIDLSPVNDPLRSQNLTILATKHKRRYERFQKVQDLEEAISLLRQAIVLTSDDGNADQVQRLSSLRDALETRYQRVSYLGDLDESISISRMVIEKTSVDQSSSFTWSLSTMKLGSQLLMRYEHAGELADLQCAISTIKEIISETPVTHWNYPDRVNILSDLLQRRFERMGEPADIYESTSRARAAVDSAAPDEPTLGLRLSNLSSTLFYQYRQFGNMVDLNDAIASARKGLLKVEDTELHDELHARLHDELHAKLLSNLGNFLYCRYDQLSDMTDLHEAISSTSQALDLLPNHHQNRPIVLHGIAMCCFLLFGSSKNSEHLEQGISNLYEAWNSPVALPFMRVRIGSRLLEFLVAKRRVGDAIEIGKAVLNQLPSIDIRYLQRNDQEFLLSAFAGVAANLCSAFLQVDRMTEALQYLEKGRAVIIGQLLDSRGDLSLLEEQYPAMARLYRDLQDDSNRYTPEDVDDDALRRSLQNRRAEVMTQLETCIYDIRSLPEHENFLQALSVSEMQSCAAGGSIVVVNISDFQSDAIIISSKSIKVVHLARLRPTAARRWLKKDWNGRRSERAKKNKEYLQYLSWLWDNCVQEVLAEVRRQDNVADNELPKVWWVGSAGASQMPFHAAGYYDNSSTENALQRAVSSYTPSVKALFHTRQRAKLAENSQGPLLIATMPITPGDAHPDLPGVEQEVQWIRATVDSEIKHLDLPSAADVINALPSCSVAHFACHGFTRNKDPSKSALVLQSNGEQDHLTVQRISQLNLSSVRLAYLSACSTAENKDALLADEVIHLVSGFQVAGFPHAVGCLWPSNDRVCSEIADVFYRLLFKDKDKMGTWKDAQVAEALRVAVKNVSNREWNMPLFWAQFVHFGV